MFEKFSTSYNLIKVSLKYIKRDGELLIYSLLSLISSLAILITFVGIDHFYLGFFESLSNGSEADQATYEIIALVGTFIYYLIFSFITFFFNTAIITSVQRRNNGEDNKLGDGLRDSMKHLKEIFIWSLINATVTTILKMLQRKFGENSMIGSLIIGLIGGMWNILTFFSFPLMILNGMGPKDAIKESGNLFKKTWGERAIIHVGVGFLFFFIYLLIIFISMGIIFSGFFFTGLAFLVLGILFMVILSTTCDVIIKTILLHYTQTGSLPNGLDEHKEILNIAYNK